MASGSSHARKQIPQEPVRTTRSLVPARATRQLPPLTEEMPEEEQPLITRALPFIKQKEKVTVVLHTTQVVNERPPRPLERHLPWMRILLISLCVATGFIGILVWAAISQRPDDQQLVSFFGGRSYSIQVGGNLVNTWQTPQPAPIKKTITVKSGPGVVLGNPTITADFINKVLDNGGSPAAGKGQALYDLGVKYGIDPVYALAFFMHESTFGTRGEARKTMSLGNLRCIDSRPCVDRNPDGTGGYAQMKSWEDGFEVWYQLIRNLYIDVWGFTTVDQMIPRYAPSSDNNNEAAYIASVKQAVGTWRSGVVQV